MPTKEEIEKDEDIEELDDGEDEQPEEDAGEDWQFYFQLVLIILFLIEKPLLVVSTSVQGFYYFCD